jgi:protein-S-isoprenylcysteine O-methyltransferase Ste14
MLAFVYGVVCYAVFLVSFLDAIGFVEGILVPKAINDGTPVAVPRAVLINVLLLSLFAVQHTIMARPGFKKWWTRFVPKPIERSTFVLVASLVLLLIFWQWRPIPMVLWHVEHPVGRFLLEGLSFAGWALVLYASFLIDHFDLFGLRQVFLHLRKRAYSHPAFASPPLYRLVRNPLMLGFVVAFWSTPYMTAGHLLFAAVTTGYILVGIQFEERDLARILGADYLRYRERTPMLLPFPRKRPVGDREGLSVEDAPT